MGADKLFNAPALAKLIDGLNGMPVPDYGDLPDAAKELIYLAVSTAQTHTDRLERIMHNRFFPLFPDLDAVSESDLPRIEAILTPLGGHIIGTVTCFFSLPPVLRRRVSSAGRPGVGVGGGRGRFRVC